MPTVRRVLEIVGWVVVLASILIGLTIDFRRVAFMGEYLIHANFTARLSRNAKLVGYPTYRTRERRWLLQRNAVTCHRDCFYSEG